MYGLVYLGSEAQFETYTELRCRGHPGVERCVREIFSRWPVPVFTGLVLCFPVSSSRSGLWTHFWKQKNFVYCWLNNNGLRWSPACVLRSCWKRCLRWTRSSRCSRSCCRSLSWSLSGLVSSCEDGSLSSSENELSFGASPSPASVGGNSLGLFGLTG